MKTNHITIKALMLITCILLLLSASCQTPYQSTKDNRDGYYSNQIDSNKFIVSFQGRGRTTSIREDFCLLQCSEITLQSGFNYFEIINRTDIVYDEGGRKIIKFMIVCYKDKIGVINERLINAKKIKERLMNEYKKEFKEIEDD